MKVSRRDFLGAATASVVGSLFFPAGLDAIAARQADTIATGQAGDLHCVVLDLKSNCVLRESLRGYQAALAGGDTCLPETRIDSRRRPHMAIVPGAGLLDSVVCGTLIDLLRAGTDVLLESGAAFLSPAEFAAHQRILSDRFDLNIEPPMELWAGTSADDRLSGHSGKPYRGKREHDRSSIPYINYVWPWATSVRDFSRIIPVTVGRGNIVGRAGRIPVALKKRVGGGTLIFLGSPLGPALLAGDREACRWLRSVAFGATV